MEQAGWLVGKVKQRSGYLLDPLLSAPAHVETMLHMQARGL